VKPRQRVIEWMCIADILTGQADTRLIKRGDCSLSPCESCQELGNLKFLWS
jgi:hypothetical protein